MSKAIHLLACTATLLVAPACMIMTNQLQAALFITGVVALTAMLHLVCGLSVEVSLLISGLSAGGFTTIVFWSVYKLRTLPSTAHLLLVLLSLDEHHSLD